MGVLLAGCAAPPAGPAPDSYTDHAGWSEYAPAWRDGPAKLAWHGAPVEIAANQSYASDGATFLYVTEKGAHDATAASVCRSGARQASGEWVLLVAPGCVWSKFPGVACDRAPQCDALQA